MTTTSTAPLTLDATLRALGYGHRATASTPKTQKHEIFRLADGAVVANLTAHEAWNWLRETGQCAEDWPLSSEPPAAVE
jgi:hypothetical protein